MYIILLAGGDGSRLWPLSNEARSKQFLRMLRHPESGNMESMVQRIVRQMREAKINCPIIVAANEQQVDAISSHMPSSHLENVEVVAEPSRRGTFPAVCLACEYLFREKHCYSQEIVVAMPCDQLVDSKYFQSIVSMAILLEKSDAELVAMGILPDFPSSNFGYIVPSEESPCDGALRVAEFREKPDETVARKLLARGAYWNSGVFAFRLGTLLKIAEKYVPPAPFKQIRENFELYPAISFDRQVAEQASGMLMVPFSGMWKDMGTWQSLLGEMDSETKGSVVGGDNVNTHVVNELQIPILCVGTKNLVVAASPDGILIADKDNTGRIKEYAQSFRNRPMFEERRWGTYQVVDHAIFADGYETLTKRLTLNPGCSISYQRHEFRDETWTFIDGEGEIVLEGERKKVYRGDTVFIRKETKHALRAVTSLSFIEVQAGSNLIEGDIERFSYDW